MLSDRHRLHGDDDRCQRPGDWEEYFYTRSLRFLSACICVLLLFAILFYYYYFEDKAFLAKARNVFLIYLVLIIAVLVCYFFGRFVSIYLRPVAMLALIGLFLFGRRQAIILNFVFSLLMFVIDTFTNNFDSSPNSVYISLMLTFACGTFAVFVAANVKTRWEMLLTGVFLGIPGLPSCSFWNFPRSTFLTSTGSLTLLRRGTAFWGACFRRCSPSASCPSLRWRSTASPSSACANSRAPTRLFCSGCAPKRPHLQPFAHRRAARRNVRHRHFRKRGARRAAAYYHDVGKLKQPECFTENQTGYNVHDELTPELSADIIRSHAQDGYELLIANHLPKEIADVAREHHGTLPIKYFYDKANRLSGGDANIRNYSYLGPTPTTKVAAIIMIADASEAATRAIKDRTPETVERIVRSVIEERMDLDQFSDCDITMRELTVIKQTLVDSLTGVHHHRVKYPAIRFNRARQAVKEESKGDE